MTMCSLSSKSRDGFTLVELAIVLVIIGLIIGGVLTGQQVIQNAKVTKALNDIQAYESQFQTYQQNYNALPGDDPSALIHFPNAGLPTTVGSGTGALSGNFDDSSAGTSETVLAWADLRAANLVKNQTPITAQPPNPFGGIYGFQNNAFGTTGLSGTVLCLNNVPGTAAAAIDQRLDDGNDNSGNIDAEVTPTTGGGATGSVPTTAGYSSASTYTMCIKL